MKKSDLFKIGVLLVATTLGTTGCSFGEDEKKPEIVVDPAEKTIEYYIAGKVTEGSTALPGVEVKAGEATATTDAEGAYKLTVDSKKAYTVTFTKEGYLSIDNAQATIADNAENRSMVSLSVKLSKQSPAKEIDAEATEEIIVTDKGHSDMTKAEAAVIVPPGAIETTTNVSITPYEEPAAATTTVTTGTVETPVAIANIEVATTEAVTLAKPVTLAVVNKASENATFEDVEVYNQKAATRAGESWDKVADAAYDVASNSYTFTLPAGATLSGKYSMRIKSSKTTGSEQIGETNKEEKKSNEGNMTAIPEYKINFEATAGWEYTVTPETALANAGVNATDAKGMASMINSAIEAQEGTTGIYKVNQELVAGISGNHILYYLNQAKYCEKKYTFKISGGKTVTITLKFYTGMKITYTNVEASQHSGGKV